MSKTKLMNSIILGGGMGLLLISEYQDSKIKNTIPKINKIKKEKEEEKEEINFPISKIFEAERYILRDQLKQNFHISIPFNRKLKYIYNLDSFYYVDYENYNFNKLSDLFLNIHIFIN